MKKHILIFYLVVSTLGISSCSDFLDVPLKSSIATSNFFKTQQDFDMALNGAYHMMTSSEWDPGHRWGNYFAGFLFLGRVGTDECFTAYGDNEAQISNYTFTPSNYIVSRTWYDQYVGISRANMVIDRMASTKVEMTQSERDRILGEAYFLRGFYYFILARYYGEVPLVLQEVVDVAAMNTDKAPLDKVYEQIVSDFKQAESLLPLKNVNGRAYRYAATAFLAKVYLQMSGEPLKDGAAAELAAQSAYTVIKSGQFELVKNYFSLFDGTNEYSSEYIFDADFSNKEDATHYGGQLGTTDGVPNPYDLYWVQVVSCKEFYEKFNEKDQRREAIADYRYVDVDGEPVIDRNPEAIGDNYYVYKFRHPLKKADRGDTWVNWSNPLNFPILRYADILLTYAEAVNRSKNGPTTEALEYVNQVRRRGFGVDIKTANTGIDLPMMGVEEFNKAILLERSFELSFEGHRWFDLVRFGKLEEAVKSLSKYDKTKELTQQAKNVKPRHVILPIPQDVIDASNGKITQNPLWAN